MMGDGSGCSVNYFCLGAVFIFVGSVLLCALGFTVVLPHQTTRAWPRVSCYVANATYHQTLCSCNHQSLGERMCLRKYPCLLITVTYSLSVTTTAENHHGSFIKQSLENATVAGTVTAEETDNEAADLVTDGHRIVDTIRPSDAMMNVTARGVPKNDVAAQPDVTSELLPRSTASGYSAETEGIIIASLYNTWSDAFYKKCALNECGAEEWNLAETRRFEDNFGVPGTKLDDCFVDPRNAQVVIIARTPYTYMIHAIVWPIACLMVGVTLWLGLCLGCWRMDKEFEPVAAKPRQYGLL